MARMDNDQNKFGCQEATETKEKDYTELRKNGSEFVVCGLWFLASMSDWLNFVSLVVFYLIRRGFAEGSWTRGLTGLKSGVVG